MASAYKCDRCGKCYDPTEFPEELFLYLNGGFVNKGVMFRDGGPLGMPFINKIGRKDFCKDCTQVILKEINKQEDTANEKESENANAIVDDIHLSLDDFFQKIGIRGRDILRRYVNGNSKSETTERKGESEQEIKD